MNQFEAHKLIPADDLHWNDEEQKRVLLSDEEIEAIVLACAKCGMADSLDDIMVIIRWAEQIRSGEKLLNGIIQGRLGVLTYPELEEPIIFPIEVLDEYRDDPGFAE